MSSILAAPTAPNIRHHCIHLCGLTPESTREAVISYYDKWTGGGVMTFPEGKPVRTERITVTADQCHTGEYWSLFMLSNHVSQLGKGRCTVTFAA